MAQVTGVDVVLHGLDAWAKGTRAAAVKAAHQIAELLEGYAKENHPWKDESGDTRASIKGQVWDEAEETILITLSAGMEYDVLLELAKSGKWAWLYPTLIANQEKIRYILKKEMSQVSVKR